MELSVIIVSYNVKYYLEQCLYALQKALKDISSEVIVFDNHSRDGSVEYLSNLFPEVNIIGGSHNLGFAKANNHAIMQSHGDYVLLLNPDTIVGEYTLRKALNFMEGHPKAGCAGVRMMRTDGSDALESRRGIPTPRTSFYKMSGLCRRFPRNHHLGKYYMGWLSWDKPAEIEIVSGAFCLLRREALDQVGLLDEDFFMYGEDIDLSYRLLKGGWENWYLPLRILHYKGESTQKSSFRYVHVFYEAMLIFLRKHYSHLGVFLTLPILFAIYSKATLTLVSTLFHNAKRNLGFVNEIKPVDSFYIFYVSPRNLGRCQLLAQSKGLWAVFHDANKNIPNELPEAKKDQKTYVVYDASEYSFDEMFERMAATKDSGAQLATYYPEKDMIITATDIIL